MNVKVNKSVCKKGCIWDPSACTCENGKYLGGIIGDSVIICNGNIKATNLFQEKLQHQKLFQQILKKKR